MVVIHQLTCIHIKLPYRNGACLHTARASSISAAPVSCIVFHGFLCVGEAIEINSVFSSRRFIYGHHIWKSVHCEETKNENDGENDV